MGRQTTDFLIIGGGVIGINLALLIKRESPDRRVVLIEKESSCGEHASGRNSGVLHAGFYYTADSHKARFTRDGNRLLTQYCQDKGTRINRCGKLVVARNAAELAGLDELMRRAKANAVELHEISAQEAQEIEPRVKTYERALFSPTTSSVNPGEVMASLVKDAMDAGIDIRVKTAYVKRSASDVLTTQGNFSAGYVINAAGLYADRIARDFGFSQDYRVIPFKGLYLYADEAPGSVRTNIYPVPNLNNPFLGVHYTLTAEGKIKIGPTAIPAFWREHYEGIKNFQIKECLEILWREFGLFTRNDFGFRSLAFQEIQKYYKPQMVRLASELMHGVDPKNYQRWGKPGIRAQLMNIKQKKLEMDFRYEGDNKSFHVLNAVSPAFTCSMSFTRYLLEEINRLIENTNFRSTI